MEKKSLYHRHKGVESNGKLKSHFISVVHKDKTAQKYHNEAVGKISTTNVFNKLFSKDKQSEKPKQVIEKPYTGEDCIQNVKTKNELFTKTTERYLTYVKDSDGYLFVDITTLPDDFKGLRVKFVKIEGRHRKTVGLQIEK
jgi:hypothetical protein